MKQLFRAFLLLLCLCSLAAPVSAASKKMGWKQDSVSWTYRNKKGKKLTGKRTIKGKTYFFDSNGRQRTGWRQIGSKYYHFKIAEGKKGYMLKSKTVNGIKLDSKGAAVVTAQNAEKLYAMIVCQKVMDSLIAPIKPLWERMRAGYDYAMGYKEMVSSDYRGIPNWDVKFTLEGLERGVGDCYVRACLCAYPFNAAGAKKVYVMSNGHCWVMVGKNFYDPSFEKEYKNNYFNIPQNLMPAHIASEQKRV